MTSRQSTGVALLIFLAALPALAVPDVALAQAAEPALGKTELPRVEKDLPYADGGDQQMLDLYLPTARDFTTIVFTFGGGWQSGSRKSVARIGEKLQELGYGCALPSHRLSPADKYPAQIEDLAAAFLWVRDNIERRGGNPKRLILMGHSSGAQLSLLLASDPSYLARHKLTPQDIAGVIGLSTPVDLEPRVDKKGFGDALMAGRGADVFGRNPETMKNASPIQHCSKTLPPVQLIVGERDFPMLEADARAYAEKARAAGATVAVFVAGGYDHLRVVQGVLENESVVQQQILAFLRDLKTPAK